MLSRSSIIAALSSATLVLVACDDAASSGGGDTGGGDTGGAGATDTCEVTADTSPSGDEGPDGCAVLDRETTSCRATREAAGLDGFWLDMSCRVELAKSGDVVTASSDGLPDHLSNYFPMSDACHEDFTERDQNPNVIESFDLDLSFPLTTDDGGGEMTGAFVGMAVNGVAIFGNFAAPGDDIYREAETFDRCAGHPQQQGQYHYHSEPHAISYDDARFVGVMLDGYPIYGRRDADGSMPSLDADGGHVGTTPHSPDVAVYHYHVHEEVSDNPGSAGQTEWFITTGSYHGSTL